MTIKDNDFTWLNIMSASPSSLREEAGLRYDETDSDNRIWKWVSEHATHEQLMVIGEYALTSDELWDVFQQHLYEAMRWGYSEFVTNKNTEN